MTCLTVCSVNSLAVAVLYQLLYIFAAINEQRIHWGMQNCKKKNMHFENMQSNLEDILSQLFIWDSVPY